MSKIVLKEHYIQITENKILRWLLIEVVEITNWGARLPQNRFGWRCLLFEELWTPSLTQFSVKKFLSIYTVIFIYFKILSDTNIFQLLIQTLQYVFVWVPIRRFDILFKRIFHFRFCFGELVFLFFSSSEKLYQTSNRICQTAVPSV